MRQPVVKALCCLSAFVIVVLAALAWSPVVSPSGPLQRAGTGWTSSLRPAGAPGLGTRRGDAAMTPAWRHAVDRAGLPRGAGWGLAADVPGSGAMFSLPLAGTTTSGSVTPPRGSMERLQDARAPPPQRQSIVL